MAFSLGILAFGIPTPSVTHGWKKRKMITEKTDSVA